MITQLAVQQPWPPRTVCVCEAQWPDGLVAWICNRKVPSSSPGQEKKVACVVSLDKPLYSHCLSPPSCKIGYLTSVGEAKDRWAARIPSSSGCGPGWTPGAHAISHCAVQRLLVHTGPSQEDLSARAQRSCVAHRKPGSCSQAA